MVEVVHVHYYVTEKNDTDMSVLSEEFVTKSDETENTNENNTDEDVSK